MFFNLQERHELERLLSHAGLKRGKGKSISGPKIRNNNSSARSNEAQNSAAEKKANSEGGEQLTLKTGRRRKKDRPVTKLKSLDTTSARFQEMEV